MIFIFGDTHGERSIRRIRMIDKVIDRNDVVIILGDFGLIFNEIQTKSERNWLRWLELHRTHYTVFIDGNHDNHNKIKSYPKVNLDNEHLKGTFHKINEKVYYASRGSIFYSEGKSFLAIGGAKTIAWDKARRKEGRDWWPTEMISKEDEETIFTNISNHNGEVDYVLSHTCPQSIFPEIEYKLPNYGETEGDPCRDILDRVRNVLLYKKWFVGHFHIDYKIDEFVFLYHCYDWIVDEIEWRK